MRKCVAVIAWLVALGAGGTLPAQGDPSSPHVEIFVQEGCQYCKAAEPFIARLRTDVPNVTVRMLDVGKDAAARKRLLALARERRIAGLGTPAFFVGGDLIVGWSGEATTGAAILSRLAGSTTARAPIPSGASCDTAKVAPTSCSATPGATQIADASVNVPLLGAMSARQVGLPVFSAVLGLLDGFNPCAMWTLIYLLALLAGLRNRAKMATIGGTFIGVGGLMYFAVMAAWLEAFVFIGVTRPVQLVLGSLALGVGAVNVKDFFAFKKGFSLSIPEVAKPGLLAQMRRVVTAENLPGAILAVALLSIMVNLFEMLCTAGFPAVFTQVLASHDLSRPAYYGYLTIYNAGYMFDDVVMLSIAVTTLSRRRLQEKEGQWLKLVSGLVMLALALVLLFKPAWLT